MDDADIALSQLAAALGEHALPVFFLALAVLMLAVVGVWRVALRWGVPREQGAMPPVAFLAVHLGLGFLLVLSAAGVFASLAENLRGGPEMGELDLVLSTALRQHVSADTLRAFAQVTRLGDRNTLVALVLCVALLLLALRQSGLALAWVLAVAGNGLLTRALKKIFERVRPEHEHGLVFEQGYSFPSGHTSGAVVAYGMLAYLVIRLAPRAWHLPMLLLASAIAFSTGCSRVFLQVHFATDVLAGFASGSVWLAVCIVSIELTRYYRRVWRA